MPREVAEGLAAAGHDVMQVGTEAPGLSDRAVLALAREHQRWLLTFDSDFGDLVFRRGEVPRPAILYFRTHPIEATEVLAPALQALGEDSDACFAVVTRDGTRKRPFDSTANDGGA